MDEFEVIFDPLKNRVEDLVKLSKAHADSLSPEFREVLLSAARLILSEMQDFHQAHQNPTAELHAFPGGKH